VARHKWEISLSIATFLSTLAGPALAQQEARVEADKWRDVVHCRSEIWNTDSCTPMITAFKKDPYPYLTYVTKTVDAASISLRSGANRGLVASWDDKMLDVIGRSEALSGFLEAQKQDLKQVRVREPHSTNFESVLAFSGCYFLRELVIAEDIAICDAFLDPAVRHFYLAMTAFRNLCGDASEARNCDALTPYYELSADLKR
jgi:hypothetical protein